jgi:glycopeptide antibiotics resistance protein
MTRRGLWLLFAVYLAALTWIVLWKLQMPWIGGVDRVLKLVPFVASGDLGASRPVEVVLNLLIFLPLGGYLRLLVPHRRWWGAGAVAAGTSLFYEVTQFVLAIGSTDATDVIVNTAGGLLGYALARRLQVDGATLQICALGTTVAVAACALFVAAPLTRAPERGPISTGTVVSGTVVSDAVAVERGQEPGD